MSSRFLIGRYMVIGESTFRGRHDNSKAAAIELAKQRAANEGRDYYVIKIVGIAERVCHPVEYFGEESEDD